MPDRRTRRQRAEDRRRQAAEAPVVHVTESYQAPGAIGWFTHPAAFILAGVAAGVLLFAVAFALRDTSSESPGGSLESTPAPTATATPEGTPTPDPRLFTSADQVIDAETYDYQATITTDAGVIVIDLFEDVAPRTVNNFVFLAQKGYYDELRWHRVVENFVAQAGDPRSAVGREDEQSTVDGPGYETAEEPNDLTNSRGRVSMAKRPGATTFGSQFFINLKDNPALDAASGQGDAFYPFGEVIEGMDVVDQVQQGDVIQSITIQEIPK